LCGPGSSCISGRCQAILKPFVHVRALRAPRHWTCTCRYRPRWRHQVDSTRRSGFGWPPSTRWASKVPDGHSSIRGLRYVCGQHAYSKFTFSNPKPHPQEKHGDILFSLTVDGLWSSTVLGERESGRAVLGPKTASGGRIRPQFSETPKRPGLRHRRQEKRQRDMRQKGPTAPGEGSLSGTWCRKPVPRANTLRIWTTSRSSQMSAASSKAYWLETGVPA